MSMVSHGTLSFTIAGVPQAAHAERNETPV